MGKNDWYYQVEDSRQGPFTKEQIREFIESKVILPDTILIDGKGASYLAVWTEFKVYFSPESISTQPAPPVSNCGVWGIILTPVIGTLIMYAFYFSGIMPAGGAFMGGFFAGFAAIDSVLLKKAGYQPVDHPFLWVIFFYPAYLFKRAKRIGHKQTLLIWALVVLIIPFGIGMMWPMLEDKDVEKLGSQITSIILAALQPHVELSSTSVTLEKRLPLARFVVSVQLSNGSKIKLPLRQSWMEVDVDESNGFRLEDELKVLIKVLIQEENFR